MTDRAARIPAATVWPHDWHGFDQRWGLDSEPGTAERVASSMDQELAREVKPGHVLDGCAALAIAKRGRTDDVLFALDEGERVAVVHLTWAKNEQPPWPSTTIYDSLGAFLADPDHAEREIHEDLSR